MSETAANSASESVFSVLKAPIRRAAVLVLDREGELPLRDLVDEVASLRQGTSVASLSSRKRTSVYAGLSQRHLDILEEIDAIKRVDGVIRPTETLHDLAATLRVVDGRFAGSQLAAGPSPPTSEGER